EPGPLVKDIKFIGNMAKLQYWQGFFTYLHPSVNSTDHWPQGIEIKNNQLDFSNPSNTFGTNNINAMHFEQIGDSSVFSGNLIQNFPSKGISVVHYNGN